LVDRFRSIPVANISDSMSRRRAIETGTGHRAWIDAALTRVGCEVIGWHAGLPERPNGTQAVIPPASRVVRGSIRTFIRNAVRSGRTGVRPR
jgi:hypothetical protein